MALAMLLQIGSLFLVGALMATAVHALSPASNPRRHRATFGTMVMVVLLMGALATLVRALAYLGLPVLLLGWSLYAVLHFVLYGGFFGLGPWRAMWMGPAKWLAFWAVDALGRWLTGPGAA